MASQRTQLLLQTKTPVSKKGSIRLGLGSAKCIDGENRLRHKNVAG